MYFPKRLLLLLRNVQALPGEEGKIKAFRKSIMKISQNFGEKMRLKHHLLSLSHQMPPLRGWSPVLVFLSSLRCPGTSEKKRLQWHNTSSGSVTSMSEEIFNRGDVV